MAQAYITDYARFYRTPPYSRRTLILPERSRFYATQPAGGNWLVFRSLGEGSGGQEIDDAKKLVYDFHRNRYWTVYQVDYGKQGKFSCDDTEVALVDIQQSCRKWQKKTTNPISPPLTTSRKVFGYMRPDNFYIPKTVYQTVYGSLACHVMDDAITKRKERERLALLQASGELEKVAGVDSKGKAAKPIEREPLAEEDKCKCGELVWQQIAAMRNLNLRRTGADKKKLCRKKPFLNMAINKQKCPCL